MLGCILSSLLYRFVVLFQVLFLTFIFGPETFIEDFGEPYNFKRFLVGIDRSKMKLYDVDESEQNLSPTKVTEKSDMFITPDLEKKLPKRSFEDFT